MSIELLWKSSGVAVGDVREDATLRGLSDEGCVVVVEECDDGTGRFADDATDVVECMLGAVAEPNQCDIGAFLARHLAYLVDVELSRDHRVPHPDDDTRHDLEPLGALVGDQDSEVLTLLLVGRSGVVH